MNELAVRSDMMITPASIEVALARYQAVKDFVTRILKEGVDFGIIPGTTKPTLYKPGAEKMAALFGLSPTFEDAAAVEDWSGKDHDGEPFFYYRQRCILHIGDRVIASADGSCNSWEKKYRNRQSERVCPKCGKPTIIKGKDEYGGGWICYGKKGGCGAKFADNAPEIVNQPTGSVRNPDICEAVNTILKMAQKRALIAAVLIATNTSEYFTQDIEDYIDAQFEDAKPEPKPAAKPIPPAIAQVAAETGATVTEGEWLPEAPIEDPSAAMDLATAEAVTTARGEIYGGLDDVRLQNMARSIRKMIDGRGKEKLTDDEAAEYQYKLDAILTILRNRHPEA